MRIRPLAGLSLLKALLYRPAELRATRRARQQVGAFRAAAGTTIALSPTGAGSDFLRRFAPGLLPGDNAGSPRVKSWRRLPASA